MVLLLMRTFSGLLILWIWGFTDGLNSNLQCHFLGCWPGGDSLQHCPMKCFPGPPAPGTAGGVAGRLEAGLARGQLQGGGIRELSEEGVGPCWPELTVSKCRSGTVFGESAAHPVCQGPSTLPTPNLVYSCSPDPHKRVLL